jgi:biopolymer transport protein ExbD
MNFKKGRKREEPEINFIPLIDVLLVILIFLMVTTTYSKYAELQINLPEASAEKAPDRPQVINIGVDNNGKYIVNSAPAAFNSVEAFSAVLRDTAAAGNMKDPVVAIGADAGASHQSVVNIMEAARMVGFTKISFTTQAKAAGK